MRKPSAERWKGKCKKKNIKNSVRRGPFEAHYKPGTYRPQTLRYGNTDHGIVYNQMSMTMNIAFGMVSLPSSGLAMTLYLLNQYIMSNIRSICNPKRGATHTKKTGKYLLLYLSSRFANLSYAIQAFVIAAPMPDSEPIRANIWHPADPRA